MVLPISNPTKSYWIEAANSPLRDARTTTELTRETDVVIVGSGYTGTTAAYWLHKFTEDANYTTPRMLMLEARDICGGATGRNGGHLRPHAYSHYLSWATQLGPQGALAVIRHEMAHLTAFDDLLREENINPESVSFKLGKTFDAAMTEEAWTMLKNSYDTMQRDLGEDGEIIGECTVIDNPKQAEEFTQMKGCCAAIYHATGQIWPYKFIHALLAKLLSTGKLNLQAQTPVHTVSERGADGWIVVKTSRGDVKTKAVVHATNRWASHLLPEFKNLIFPSRSILAALQAPERFFQNTGAQYWDGNIYNYYVQLPSPYNVVVIGGGKLVTAREPTAHILSDNEDKLHEGIPEYYRSWPASGVVKWPEKGRRDFALPLNEGGCWSEGKSKVFSVRFVKWQTPPSAWVWTDYFSHVFIIMSSTVDNFPYVGDVPNHPGHFISAGYGSHGMPRILLSTAHIAPLILEFLRVKYTAPNLVTTYPPLPEAYRATPERIQKLQKVDAAVRYDASIKSHLESSQKPFCRAEHWQVGSK